MFARFKARSHAVSVARKHVANWPSLVLRAVLRSEGTFRSRAGGVISYDAKKLLKQLVRLEDVWKCYGDSLSVVKFEDDYTIIIPDYFGRYYRIHLNAEGVSPPSCLVKLYPFNVSGEIVLT